MKKPFSLSQRASWRIRLRTALVITLVLGTGAMAWHFVARSQRDYETGRDKVVRVPGGIDHRRYDRLLKTYVNEDGLVDYAAWQASAVDLEALEKYLGQYAAEGKEAAEGDELSAALINGYNAFVISSVLERYPVDSIMSLSHPFEGRRHPVGGEKVSLDDLEHANLIPHFGYRSHAVLVCAAQSCPPLRREAYLPSTVQAQADDNFRVWLGRGDLNRFHPDGNRVEVSSIFKWFQSDFKKAGGLREVLARHAPTEHRKFLAGEDDSIEYLPYDWALNDRNSGDFSKARLIWKRFLDFFR